MRINMKKKKKSTVSWILTWAGQKKSAWVSDPGRLDSGIFYGGRAGSFHVDCLFP